MSNNKRNYYDVLEVAHDTEDAAIKRAYMKLSLKYHPDRNPNNLEEATSKFQEINEAYETLKDPQSRNRYDAELNGMGGDIGIGDINDIFNMMFGGMGGMGGVNMGGMNMGGVNMGGMGGVNMGGMNMGGMNMGGMNMGGMRGVNMARSPFGPGVQVFHMGPMGMSQMHPGMAMNMGADLFGDQFFQQFHSTPQRESASNSTSASTSASASHQKPNPITKQVTVPLEKVYSGGDILVEIERSRLRNGLHVTEIETVSVNIPQGIQENETLLLQGMGNAHNEHTVGDLQIVVKIENNTGYERHDNDLYLKRTVTLKESLCGFMFDIKHVNGKLLQFNNMVNTTIIKPNFKKVLPGLGMIRDNITGNLVIEFDVVFPETLTQDQICQLKQIL